MGLATHRDAHPERYPVRQIWVQVPLASPAAEQRQYRADAEAEKADAGDPWLWWDRLRNATCTESRLGVCLRVGADLPESRCLDRWMGEPVKCVMLAADVFISNKVSWGHEPVRESYMHRRCSQGRRGGILNKGVCVGWLPKLPSALSSHNETQQELLSHRYVIMLIVNYLCSTFVWNSCFLIEWN